MSERFIKLLQNEKTGWLLTHHSHAFILLTLIATRARRTNGHPDGLIIGDALVSSSDLEPGMSRQNFRTALDKLVEFGFIKIVSNGKRFFEREKSTIKVTITGTLVNLLGSTIYDINPEEWNQPVNQRVTNDQPTANHKQERRRMKKNEKESHPSIPSKKPQPKKRHDGMMDDFSSEKEKTEIIPGIFLSKEDLEACVKIKGSLEKVQKAIESIQKHPKRKKTISDWPNTLMNWKVGDDSSAQILDHITYAEELCKEFQEHDQGRGWRCYMHNHATKDQRGILFESQSAYQEAFFVALADRELKSKCEDFIKSKNMRKK